MLPALLAIALCSLAELPGSTHARELDAHAFDAPFRAPPAPRLLGPGTLGNPRVNRVVYGYYPYWVTEWSNIRWDMLTHIAFFADEINADGTVANHHGWPDANFVSTAHDYGVRVDLCFTLFSGSGITTLIGSAATRAATIDTMVTEMEAGGADGVNIDFEGLEAGSRDNFTAFIRELRTALMERGHPDGGIGIAGPAVDWTNSFDLGALAPLIDVYFIMGYGYHYGGSTQAGPEGQLRVTSSWRPHINISYERTLDHYTSLVPAELREKIVLGVPYYGEDWPVGSATIHAATTGTGSSRTYAAARRQIAAGRARLFDADSENAWYADNSSGAWHQTWYDDEESLASKYQLALEQDLGGVGMWALGYDEDYPELWDTLDAYFTDDAAPLSGTRSNPIVISKFPFAEHNDTRAAPSNYFNRYSCSAATAEYGREWVYQFELCEPGRVDFSVTDGAGVDVDLHLLSAPIEAACIARNDAAIGVDLEVGVYYLVADTFVSDYVAQAGAFDLSATFTPAPNSPGCEPAKHPAHGIDETASVDQVAGRVVRMPGATDVPIIEPHVVASEESCGCLASRTGGRAGSAWILVLLVLAIRITRRR